MTVTTNLPGVTPEGLGSLQGVHVLTFGLEQVARDDPLCSFGAAWVCAGRAILYARPIGHSAVRAHQAGGSQLFPCRTDKHIGLRVKGKLGTGEKAFGLMLPVEQRNVRLDPTPHQPPDHQPRCIGGVRCLVAAV
jgi:hypothetical protein